MKALDKNQYSEYDVSHIFNEIILNHLEGYSGKKKEQLKSFLEDLSNGLKCLM